MSSFHAMYIPCNNTSIGLFRPRWVNDNSICVGTSWVSSYPDVGKVDTHPPTSTPILKFRAMNPRLSAATRGSNEQDRRIGLGTWGDGRTDQI